ncbi:N-succinylarginine dihydrolase [Sphingomonas sp. OK281]|uniref:N-succinylarginine dihydrolase n=1 Tax=Sphingomonas sp. OK281 TaxID=1881067 RepID=UPI0008F44AC2|nr:N-succinylarginine dihydrolase [Sphingomonas sp. OK281]SFN79635.1 succinylarginine dihydrolase [Sphingomonas sp. OK281]
MIEINFDGIIGPTHNYAGLSLGNRASSANAGAVSAPRMAALQGVAKMRRLMALGLEQGVFLPHVRPNVGWLRALGFVGSDAEVCATAWASDRGLMANAMSASAMWTANAGTVSPATDTADGLCHISIANLSTMPHRASEAEQTERQLRLAFADPRFFRVHSPVPAAFGDEGAANFMRLVPPPGAAGDTRPVEILVYGKGEAGGFPARQHRVASEAVARRHGLDPARVLVVRQSDEAIAAGAFHNDVVAVSNGHVLFAHEHAFADPSAVRSAVQARMPDAVIVEVPASRVSLNTAIRTYLFNSQLVTVPAAGGMALILPAEARENEDVWGWLNELVAGGGPIRKLEIVDVRESMRNGGGPACLRLRVQVTPEARAAIDPRFLLDDDACTRVEAAIARHWPEAIAPDDLGDPRLWEQCTLARSALTSALGFAPDEI